MIENQQPKKDNLLLDFGFNLILPILCLRKGADWFGKPLGEQLGVDPQSTLVSSIMLIIAIAFPIGYGIWDFISQKKCNFLSVIGVCNALLTGGIGIIPGATVQMYAIKEAAFPAILGALTVLTLKTKRPLVHLFLFNPKVVNVNLINERLKVQKSEALFQKLMTKCTWLIGLTFILSAILNYFLACWIVVTEPAIDKTAYNDEVGQMMGWSFPIIILPCMVTTIYTFWVLMKGIKELTGLSLEEAMTQRSSKKA